MITFLLEEGVLTVGTLSGLFTTGLLNSLKANIIDPGIENVFPSQNIEPSPQELLLRAQLLQMQQQPPPQQPPPQQPPPQQPPGTESKSSFGDIFPIPCGTPPPPTAPKNVIRWKTFLKDFITWLITMYFLYIFWKKIIRPLKVNRP